MRGVVAFLSPTPDQKWSLSLRTPFPPDSFQVLLLLTQVYHERNKAPTDGKLASLEKLLQPLLGLFAQLHHGDSPGNTLQATAATASEIRKKKETRTRQTHSLYGRRRERRQRRS